MLSHTLLDAGRDPDAIPRGPGGDILTFNMQGEPISLREAIELCNNLERITLVWTPIALASGQPAIVRTIYRVFDDEASRGPVPQEHTPQMYISVLYTPPPESRFLARLWTYSSVAEAQAGHPEATAEFQSGRIHVDA